MDEHQAPNHEAMPHVDRKVEAFKAMHDLTGEGISYERPKLITGLPTGDELLALQARLERERLEQEAVDDARRAKWKAAERLRSKRRRIAGALTVAAFVGITFTGIKAAPEIKDHFVDSGDVASEAIDATDDISEYFHQDEQTLEAKNEVVSLFDEADKHGYDAIIRDADEWKQEHSQLFIEADELETIRTNIEHAESNSGVLKALQTFMKFYDKEASFESDVSSEANDENVKKAALAYIHVLSPLPKDFVSLAVLDRVSITNKANIDNVGGKDEGMYYTHIAEYTDHVTSWIVTSASPGEHDSQVNFDATVAHEFGHALDESEALSLVMMLPNEVQTYVLEHDSLRKGFLGRPITPTKIATTDSSEFRAELIAGLLSKVQDMRGLADVDDPLLFSSGSNRLMIGMLWRLETEYKGIARLVVANRAKQ